MRLASDGPGWERAGSIEVGTGLVAFADAGTLGPEFVIAERDLVGSGSPAGLEGSIVMERVGARGRLPVDVYVAEDGSVTAARVYAAVDGELGAGEWVEVGELNLMRGQCLAGDPRLRGDGRRLGVRVRTGRYAAERFVPDGGAEPDTAAGTGRSAAVPTAVALQVRITGRRKPGEQRREPV